MPGDLTWRLEQRLVLRPERPALLVQLVHAPVQVDLCRGRAVKALSKHRAA